MDIPFGKTITEYSFPLLLLFFSWKPDISMLAAVLGLYNSIKSCWELDESAIWTSVINVLLFTGLLGEMVIPPPLP